MIAWYWLYCLMVNASLIPGPSELWQSWAWGKERTSDGNCNTNVKTWWRASPCDCTVENFHGWSNPLSQHPLNQRMHLPPQIRRKCSLEFSAPASLKGSDSGEHSPREEGLGWVYTVSLSCVFLLPLSDWLKTFCSPSAWCDIQYTKLWKLDLSGLGFPLGEASILILAPASPWCARPCRKRFDKFCIPSGFEI